MGEAKRRKAAAAARAASYRNAVTGAPAAFRLAGDPLEFLDRRAEVASGSAVKVPCAGCRECCYHAGVDVDPGNERAEDLAHLDLVQRDGGWFLRRQADGACVHLGPNGCTVYQHRPAACRTYDCRVFALTGVLDGYSGDHAQPAWVFEPRTLKSRVHYAVWRLMGMIKLKQLKTATGKCSAADVVRAVTADTELFGILWRGVLELAQASPEQQQAMLGFDPAEVTPEQLQTGMRQWLGDAGDVLLVRDPGDAAAERRTKQAPAAASNG